MSDDCGNARPCPTAAVCRPRMILVYNIADARPHPTGLPLAIFHRATDSKSEPKIGPA
jgi:hypothetical protein